MWNSWRPTEWEEKGSGQLQGHVGRGHGSVQHKRLNKISLNCLFVSVFCLTWYSLRYKVITMVNYLLLSNTFNSFQEPHFIWSWVHLALHQNLLALISSIVDLIENLPISSILAHLDTFDTTVKRSCQIEFVFIDNLKKWIICEANL